MTRDELLAQASEPDDFGDALELVTLPRAVAGKVLRVVVRALSREERFAVGQGIPGFAMGEVESGPEAARMAFQMARDAAREAMVKPAFTDELWAALHDENQAAIFTSAMRLGAAEDRAAEASGVATLATFPDAAGSGAGNGG